MTLELSKQLELSFFELTESFKELRDEHVWKRPTEGLLSIGEIAGHIAYWEAIRFAGGKRDLSDCKIQSPLLDPHFGYFTSTITDSPNGDYLNLSAGEVLNEVIRIHEEAMQHFSASNLTLESKPPHWHSNYEELLRYTAFHIAYHTGQISTTRHLLGEVTPDN